MSADEKRIREFAYQIWESEGRPDGHESRHWEMARKLAEAQALAPDKSPARKASKPKLPSVEGVDDGKPVPAKPAAKAAPAAKPAAKAAPKPAAKPKPAAAAKAPGASDKPALKTTAAEQPPKPAVKRTRKPAAP
ncbi:DUF2934 domain-containing protein [Pseudomonas syringae]|nr:DUF2934 domain-containing protein [Pseudomonas syringae]MBD8572652.1 DUF2934 domain-containing protein [Pseudomonas syringae]MBD8793054.1 DUF2934 domain-containing protein [Pseudomonas syringae]MBD8803733.1 DUF2934 domain-containing protein [Pseudomonas syringae]MBD8814306.1 DUF2934 domain-containing protein [Pseudomonas syringae]